MSSYLSSLLTTTTSRYNSIRRAILPDETDGDTEDDTHMARVLRAYYTEKGRPFPPWLPVDPKAPAPPPSQFATSSRPAMMSPTGGRNGPGGGGPGLASSSGGLSDLWDSPSGPPGRPGQDNKPSSFRGAGLNRARPGQQAQGVGMMGDDYGRADRMPQARPLPSQRAGTYQGQYGPASSAPPPPPHSTPPATEPAQMGGTAQERLKARLWGGKSANQASDGAAPPQPGGASGPGLNPYNQRNPMERETSSSSFGGRSASPYARDQSGGGSGYSSNSGSYGGGYASSGGGSAGAGSAGGRWDQRPPPPSNNSASWGGSDDRYRNAGPGYANGGNNGGGSGANSSSSRPPARDRMYANGPRNYRG